MREERVEAAQSVEQSNGVPQFCNFIHLQADALPRMIANTDTQEKENHHTLEESLFKLVSDQQARWACLGEPVDCWKELHIQALANERLTPDQKT